MIFWLIFSGTSLRDFGDCRQHGCVNGECIRDGSQYVCRQGMSIFNITIFLHQNV